MGARWKSSIYLFKFCMLIALPYLLSWSTISKAGYEEGYLLQLHKYLFISLLIFFGGRKKEVTEEQIFYNSSSKNTKIKYFYTNIPSSPVVTILKLQ